MKASSYGSWDGPVGQRHGVQKASSVLVCSWPSEVQVRLVAGAPILAQAQPRSHVSTPSKEGETGWQRTYVGDARLSIPRSLSLSLLVSLFSESRAAPSTSYATWNCREQSHTNPSAKMSYGGNAPSFSGHAAQGQQDYPDLFHRSIPSPEDNMGSPRPPKLGASYVPGGYDDFYMPEVVSPFPQRIMPEVPSNMQDGLAHLELEANNPRHHVSTSSVSSIGSIPITEQRINPPLGAQRPSGPGYTASYNNTNASAYQNISKDYKILGMRSDMDSPSISPFPKLQNPGQNVPLSDEDKEEVLERARHLVLKSTDPEMQLAWAQDALSWVEISNQYAARMQPEGQTGRPITPKAEHQLREDALNIVKHLAGQGHPRAEFMKAMWLEFGKFGYRIDKKEAFLGYRRAAERGYARAEYRIGMQYENANNSAKAVEHYQKGVALKDSASNYRLGMMTLLGQHGMQQNYPYGIDLVRFAAETADENAPQGAYVYGMLLARELPNISVPDEYLPYDMNEAKLYIEKGAYLGFAKAQLKMGQAYELCQLGCEFDPALSLHYNALASRQGEAEADMAISKWFLCGYEGIFEKNEELAFTYAKRAAESKMPTAEFAMGYFYEVGIYVQLDLQESETWYQKAAQHGNKDALGRIDSIRKNSTLSKKDHEQIAITRIKSQYGSQRGGRPDRFKQKPAPMPSMSEDRTEMPDHRNSYGAPTIVAPETVPDRRVSYGAPPIVAPGTIPDHRNSYSGPQIPPLRFGNNNILPPRSASTAPYPEDDVKISPAFNSVPRPLSGVVPGPQADRPLSAFGIRPLVHADTYSQGQGRGQGLRPNSEVPRPSTSMGNMPVSGGRGQNPAERGRVVSTGTGWEPQVPSKYREPSPNRPPTLPQVGPGGPDFKPNQQNPGPNRLSKGPPNLNKPQPQPTGNSPYPPDPRSRQQDPAVQRRDPTANQFIRPERGSSMTPTGKNPMSPPLQQNHPRHDSMPQIHQGRHDSLPPQQQSQSRISQRPPQQTMSSQQGPPPRKEVGPTSATPPAAPANSAPPRQDSRPTSTAPSSSGGPVPPKKQGPSTFEEMGIPAANKESDCSIM